jgi:hypothetical protein
VKSEPGKNPFEAKVLARPNFWRARLFAWLRFDFEREMPGLEKFGA